MRLPQNPVASSFPHSHLLILFFPVSAKSHRKHHHVGVADNADANPSGCAHIFLSNKQPAKPQREPCSWRLRSSTHTISALRGNWANSPFPRASRLPPSTCRRTRKAREPLLALDGSTRFRVEWSSLPSQCTSAPRLPRILCAQNAILAVAIPRFAEHGQHVSAISKGN